MKPLPQKKEPSDKNRIFACRDPSRDVSLRLSGGTDRSQDFNRPAYEKDGHGMVDN